MSNLKQTMGKCLMLVFAAGLCLPGSASAVSCSWPAPGVTVCDFNGDGLPDGGQVVEFPAGVLLVAQAQAQPGESLGGIAFVTTQQSTPAGNVGLLIGTMCYDAGANGGCDQAILFTDASALGQGVGIAYFEFDGHRVYCVFGATTPLGCGQLT